MWGHGTGWAEWEYHDQSFEGAGFIGFTGFFFNMIVRRHLIEDGLTVGRPSARDGITRASMVWVCLFCMDQVVWNWISASVRTYGYDADEEHNGMKRVLNDRGVSHAVRVPCVG